MLIWRNLPINNPKPLLPNINSHIKFEEKQSKNTQDRKRIRYGDGRTDGRHGFLVVIKAKNGYLCDQNLASQRHFSHIRGAFGKFLAWSFISVTNLQTLPCLVSF